MKKLIFFLVAACLCSASYSQSENWYETMFLDITLPEKVELPKALKFLENSRDSIILGIDFSHYTGSINWDIVSADTTELKPKFIILRSTMGADSIDNHYLENVLYATTHDFLTGSYHYFRSHQNGKEQALWYLKNTHFECSSFIPIVDIEYKRKNISADLMRKELLECLQTLENHLDVPPMIYSNLAFYREYLEGYPEFVKYRLWIAAYSEIRKNEVMSFADMYQFSDNYFIQGIELPVDANLISIEKILPLLFR